MAARFRLSAGEQDAEHAAEEAELHQSRRYGEKDTEDDQKRNEGPSPGEIAN